MLGTISAPVTATALPQMQLPLVVNIVVKSLNLVTVLLALADGLLHVSSCLRPLPLTNSLGLKLPINLVNVRRTTI